ncbi:MAG TPA: iron-sulfur cluster assembly scaffold protein [Nautiliaceae bacterium]|nr:iron-sulfur cluster assembly scaffold protein [Nautiliaceae bacterium]
MTNLKKELQRIEYTDLVIEHFRNPRNLGEIRDADVVVTEGSPACGDLIALYLKIDPETKKITDIKFKSYGCASNIATASMMTEIVKGKTIEEAKKITWKEITEALGGLPPVKVHCSVLAVDALKSAIKEYEKKIGNSKEEEIDDKKLKEIILEELEKIMHPKYGEPITKHKLIKYLGKQNSKWLIEIGFDDENYKENIMEELKEHLDKIKEEYKIDYEIKEVPFNV